MSKIRILYVASEINPFLRSRVPTVISAAEQHDALGVAQNGVFATLRQWKNGYP